MPSLDDRAAIASYPNAVDGLSVQHASSVAAGSAFLFYLEKPLEIDLTPSRFYAAGGIAYLIEPRDGGESFADSLPALIGDRATAVAVGPHPGMLTWADPTIEGVRSHNLYWADGRNNYSMIGVREPERLVNLAREVVCRSQ